MSETKQEKAPAQFSGSTPASPLLINAPAFEKKDKDEFEIIHLDEQEDSNDSESLSSENKRKTDIEKYSEIPGINNLKVFYNSAIHILNNGVDGCVASPSMIDLLKIEGYGIPLHDTQLVESGLQLKSYYSTARWMGRYLIPSIIFSAIAHDIINFYAHPSERYDVTLASIFSGLAANEHSWGLLGSFDRGLAPPFIWPIVFGLSPVLFPLIATPIWKSLSKLYENGNIVADLEHEILWMSISKEERIAKLKQLIQGVQEQNLCSIFAVLRIAASFSENDLKRFIISSDIQNDLRKIKQEAIDALKAYNPIMGLYAKWKAAKHASLRNRYDTVAFIGAMIALYACGRYVELFIQKIILSNQYKNDRNQCLSLNNTYAWADAIANYECTPCGDWPMVSYRDSLTAEGCLTKLFSEPHSPETLIGYCNSLMHPRFITSLDFSHQLWATWSLPEFKNVLNALKNACKPGLETIRFAVKNDEFNPSPVILETIADFINYLQPSEVTLSGLQLEYRDLNAWLTKLSPQNNIQSLDLSNNPLGKSGLQLFVKHLTNFTQLHTLNLSNTDIDDLGLTKLALAMCAHPNITTLDISANAWTDEGLLILTNNWSQYHLQSLDISVNSLSTTSALALSAAMKSRPLKKLIAASCTIDDDILANLVADGVSLEEIVLADNTFTGMGLDIFLNATVNSPLETLDIANNGLTDDSMESLGQGLAKTNISTLLLSGNLYTAEGLVLFIPGLSASRVSYLALDHIAWSDDAMLILADYLNQSTSNKLFGLWLNDAAITNAGAQALLATSNDLDVLSLNNNAFDAEISSDLSDFIKRNPQLDTLNIAGNQFNGTLLKDLALGNISVFDISNNPVESEAVLNFTKKLIRPTPHIEDLGDEYISIDERRALMHALPSTSLSFFHINNIALDNQTQRGLDRMNTAINLQISVNHFSNSPQGLFHAPSSGIAIAGIGLMPLGLLVGLGLMGGILLVCVLYQGMKKICNQPSANEENHLRLNNQ